MVPTWELAERIGRRVEIDARTVGELIDIGIVRYGEDFRRATERTLIVVNGRGINYLKGRKTRIGPDDEVWFLKPAAGG